MNKAIKREQLQLPMTEEIFAEMSRAQYFSKLDTSQGYSHIRVDEESSKLLTFATPFGHYRYKRLPYGIHSASEFFQVEIANLIAGIEGTANSEDNNIVFTPTKEEHDHPLEQVMKNIQKAGLKLNRAKCVFGAKEIIFFGHHVSGEGIKVDPSKVSAILDMPIPQNRKELQSFSGDGYVPWEICQELYPR